MKKWVAEVLGTFVLVFTGCGAVMIAERFPGTLTGPHIALTFGVVVAVLVYGLGHISGAHFNPAVTLAFSITGHFPKRSILPYVSAQCLGAWLAIGSLLFLLPQGKEFAMTLPKVPLLQAFLWEFILTFMLMFVVYAVATDDRAVTGMAGLAIGAMVSLDAIIGGPVTGASMNPARSLGPALWAGNLEHYWIYLLAPCIGALSAASMYQWLRKV